MLRKIFWSTLSNKEKIEKYQKIIRENEWNELSKYIPENSNFLDIGCGAGHNLIKAKVELNCTVKGIDPSPGEHGVGRYAKNKIEELDIVEGYSENLPFEDRSFDIVFCSHVLEHVIDERKSLNEMNRVLNDNGILIIGMPTASMTVISYISQIIFTSHIKFLFFFKSIFKKDIFKKLVEIFIPKSHSFPRAKYIIHDLFYYRARNWENIVSRNFKIKSTIKPYLYPYPDFPQFFKIHKNIFFSSSVFFICEKYK